MKKFAAMMLALAMLFSFAACGGKTTAPTTAPTEATVKVEDAAAQINQVIDQVTAQMQQAQESVIGTKSILQDAAATLYAIKPEEQ